MKRLTVIVIVFLFLNCLAETAWSKGAIIKFVVEGVSLSSPIEITDPKVLHKFTIWSGPRVAGWELLHAIPPAAIQKFIIDWSIEHPDYTDRGPKRDQYFVRIHIADREPPQDTYEVLYLVASGVPRGYVYLPSYPMDEFGQWNTFQIHRGVEGSWFYSTKEWDNVIRPLLGKE